jgi:hypothetical protein
MNNEALEDADHELKKNGPLLSGETYNVIDRGNGDGSREARNGLLSGGFTAFVIVSLSIIGILVSRIWWLVHYD